MDDAGARLSDLAEGRVGRLMVKYSWPALVSMTLNALYAAVDRFYIGRWCGQDAMAGVSLALPVMMALGAFGVWIGTGHFPVISLKLGEGDHPAAERALGQMLFLKLALFVALPPLLWFNLDRVLGFAGGAGVTPEALEQGRAYLRIVVFSHVFSHVAFGLSGAMRAEGAAFDSMLCMITGFGLNLLLDPLFIFAFGMGVEGAAWATVIAMAASCFQALAFYWRGRGALRLRWRNLRPFRGRLLKPLGVGFGPFLQQTSGALVCLSLQLAFAHFAADSAEATAEVASLGIFEALLLVAFTPIMGVQQGISPIVGFNWGARNWARVRAVTMAGFWVLTAVCAVACVAQTFGAGPLTRCFTGGNDPLLARLAARDLRLANCMLWCISLNLVATTFYQGIGHPRMAIFLSFLRQGVCLVPTMWILPAFFEDKTAAIWLSMPVSDVLCCLFTIPPFFLQMRFLSRASAARLARGPARRRVPGSPKENAPWRKVGESAIRGGEIGLDKRAGN